MNELSPSPLKNDEILILAERMHQISLHRSYAFKTELFENPAWLIALTLFIADRTHMAVTQGALRGANMLTEEQSDTAIAQMLDQNIIILGPAGPSLTAEARTQIENYVKQVAAVTKNPLARL